MASVTQIVGTLCALLLCATACTGSPPPNDAGPGTDADLRLDSAMPDAGPNPIDAALVDVVWASRSCDVTVRYAAPAGVGGVQIAGDFTDWATSPLDLRDDDGDGTYEITLSPSTRLLEGTLYAYKLVVDGAWILDPAGPLRRYDDTCQNSALLIPPCTSAPEIRADALETTYDAVSGTGGATARVTLLLASDESPPSDISLTIDGVELSETEATIDRAAGAYDIALTSLSAGRHVISVRVTDMAGRAAEPVDLPFWIEAERFVWSDATMYMIVVDRFANGDTTNDAPVGSPVERPADFHGGDLQGATAALEAGYFDELGVNVIWLSPINQQAEGHFPGRESGRRFAGYHGYWPSRGREVEPRFGGNDALRAFVDAAHARGIRVLFDLINNQIHEQHEYYTSNPEWFRTGCVCGIDAGCGWSERPLDCLFAPYLPDIDWRVPGAEAQFIDDAVFWVDEMGVDGFRIDAVKHVEPSSIYNLRAALNRRFEQGGERLFLVGETAVGASDSFDYGCGETYSNGYAWIDAFVGELALDGQFDFPSHHGLQDGLVTGAMTFGAVEQVVRDLETRYASGGQHVRFLGTHDSNRIASRAAFDPAQGCRWAFESGCGALPLISSDPAVYDRIRRAFIVLYTIPGIPFLYYGDEVGAAGGNDPDNRRDMVFTDSLSGLAMSGSTLSGEQSALRDDIRRLGRARSDSLALRRGRRVPLLVTDDLYVYAYAHDDATELAVVVANRGGPAVDLRIDGLTGSMIGSVTAFDAAAGSGSASLSGGRLSVSVPAGGAAVFLGR